jgi:LAS superfamily LD-carboxypeptidase LdcB
MLLLQGFAAWYTRGHMNRVLVSSRNSIIVLLSVILALLVFFLWRQDDLQQARIKGLEVERDRLTTDLASTTAAASSTITALEAELQTLKDEYGILSDDYASESERNNDFEKQIKKISKTVGVLDTLSKTDKELLQKYSKVYFLNEHYIPEALSQIDNEWKYTESKDLKLHSKVVTYFDKMVKDAKADGVDLWVVSAYRSFTEQASLKGQYLITYGSGANTFSADQGYSEHQLGTTIDFTTKGLSGGLNGFGSTPAYEWLKENAYKYGFTLSYPEGNTYYEYEPWHWRFVGEKLAKDLHRDNAHFYDWEQRKIDGYLINIFD